MPGGLRGYALWGQDFWRWVECRGRATAGMPRLATGQPTAVLRSSHQAASHPTHTNGNETKATSTSAIASGGSERRPRDTCMNAGNTNPGSTGSQTARRLLCGYEATRIAPRETAFNPPKNKNVPNALESRTTGNRVRASVRQAIGPRTAAQCQRSRLKPGSFSWCWDKYCLGRTWRAAGPRRDR